jgi:hypothetical protein
MPMLSLSIAYPLRAIVLVLVVVLVLDLLRLAYRLLASSHRAICSGSCEMLGWGQFALELKLRKSLTVIFYSERQERSASGGRNG